MAYYAFDPIAVETEMVKAGLLPPRADVLPSKLGLLEKHFTEKARASGRCGESQ
jgi:hypothetical protein